MTVHLLAFAIGDGRYGWPVCMGTRNPILVASERVDPDPEQATCLRCLDTYTRPAA